MRSGPDQRPRGRFNANRPFRQQPRNPQNNQTFDSNGPNIKIRGKLILAKARYDKELESPYEDAEQTLRALSSRYRIGVIANQPAGTEERLAKWGLMPSSRS